MYEPVPFHKSIFKNHSGEAKELIKQLLRKHPENRYSMEQVVESEWFDEVRELLSRY